MLKLSLKKHLIRQFSISPLDDRYLPKLQKISEYFSEKNLMRERVKIESEWLKILLQKKILKVPKGYSIMDIGKKFHSIQQFDESDYQKIKEIEKDTQHDIKAVEYFFRQKLYDLNLPTQTIQFTHFLCTSEDINNLAYSLMLKKFQTEYLYPQIKELLELLLVMVEENSNVAMVSRTHGQIATPTTLGKELANFTYRLYKISQKIKNHQFEGKMNGAVGNFNSHYVVYPQKNWIEITNEFIENNLGLQQNLYTTQIEPHDSMCQDIWQYISKGYFKLKVVDKEVGSSIMPHKVNPILFENAEGNLGMANGIFEFFQRKLPISRFQRDLSDSSVLRNIGVSMGYSSLAYQNILSGLNRLTVDQEFVYKELDQNWQVLAEPIQQILRNEGFPDAYEHLKKFTRGKIVQKEDIEQYIDHLNIGAFAKNKLRDLIPHEFIGQAAHLSRTLRENMKDL